MVRGILFKQKIVGNSAITRKRAASFADIKHNCGSCRKRQKIIDCAMKDNDVPVDYTSLLPDPLLHHILSYLSAKDAARSSVLSKRWKEVRDTCPVVEFDQRCFVDPSNAGFQKYVDGFLQKRLEQKYSILVFKLACATCDSKLASHINRWLDVAVKSNVKEIDLHMQSSNNGYPYSMPSSVLAAKTLHAITLHWCKLEVPNGLDLPYLRKLCLKRMTLTEKTLQRLTSSCTSIECLSLISCKGLVNLEISTLERLNRVDLHFCKGIRKVEIVCPKLESFWYYGYKYSRRCAINLLGCPSLKKLTLEDPFMDDLSFERLVYNFPYLEHLVLSKCNAMTKIKISQAQLKSLILRGCKNIAYGDFHASQLVSFEYSGGCNLLFSFLNPLSLRKAKLQFESMPEGLDFATLSLFFTELHKFLSSFDQPSGLKLVMRHKKNIAVYQCWKDFELPLLQNMKFEVIKPSMKFEDLLDYLLRTYQPETLSLVADAEWQKIMLEKLINQVGQRGKLDCCTYYTRKCWRHYLKDSSVGYFTLPAFNNELNIWMTSVKAPSLDELPSTTLNLVWHI